MKLLTPSAPGVTCGPEVTVELQPGTPMFDLKLRLQVTMAGWGVWVYEGVEPRQALGPCALTN